MFELCPVLVELGMMEFAAKEFCDYLFLRQRPMQAKAAVNTEGLMGQLTAEQRNKENRQQNNHQEQLHKNHLAKILVEGVDTHREDNTKRQLNPACIR